MRVVKVKRYFRVALIESHPGARASWYAVDGRSVLVVADEHTFGPYFASALTLSHPEPCEVLPRLLL